jgi:glycosyltransferase involved in cell wall biosynthesis
VYNGVDCKLFTPGSRQAARERLGLTKGEADHPSRPLILFVGNLVPVKGPDILIDACMLLARKGLSFECRLIGQGRMKIELGRLIFRYRLQNRVRLVGPIPLNSMPDWYRAANLLVLPSRSDGIPNVLLEAIACGTPVVASEAGSISEIAQEVCPVRSDGVASAIEKFLSRPPPTVTRARRPIAWQDSVRSLEQILLRLRKSCRAAG